MTEMTIETGLSQVQALHRTIEKLLRAYSKVRVEFGIEVLEITNLDQVPTVLPREMTVRCYCTAEDWRQDKLVELGVLTEAEAGRRMARLTKADFDIADIVGCPD